MRLLALLFALVLAAPAHAGLRTDVEPRVHDHFVSQVTLLVQPATAQGWLVHGSGWELTEAEMNPIVTSAWARNYFEALATRKIVADSPWALFLFREGSTEAVPALPHRVRRSGSEQGLVALEFSIQMDPTVMALELRHDEAVVHRWDRPAEQPPRPDLQARCAGAASGPISCSSRWTPPPEGTWVQLMSRAGKRPGAWGSWRDHRLGPGRSEDSPRSRGSSLQLELSFTDGFRCHTQRLTVAPR
jgi:hypothetical protein